MRALVLSGGGSKGSYEIGVWKALRKLHIKFDIVTGTSIGALNGALITQGSFYKALHLWKKLNLKVLFGEDISTSNSLDIYKMYGKNFLKNGGMDVKEIENIIDKTVNRKKFYNSKINYGLVTFNLSKAQAIEIEKKDIKEEKLVDYLMASATCYPAFKKKDIEGLKFLDGGIYDNMPINLALKMNASEIVAVDLRAPGMKKTPKKKVPTTIISPNNKLTNFLNFYEEGTARNIKFGYNDTMKVYNKLEGKEYTFKKNQLSKVKKQYQEFYEHIIKNILNSKTLIKAITDVLNITTNENKDSRENIFFKIMEETGKTFNLDETKIYSYKKYNKLLRKKLKNHLKDGNYDKKNIATVIEFYQTLKEKKYKDLQKKALTHPFDLLKAVYLFTIIEA